MTKVKRSEVFSLRLSTEEKQRIHDAASRHGVSPADFMRSAVLRHVDDPAVWPGQTILVNVPAVSTSATDDRLLLARLRRLIAQGGVGW